MGKIAKDSCPWYLYKAKEAIVTSCDGDVKFEDFEAIGVCQSCGREVPLYLEM